MRSRKQNGDVAPRDSTSCDRAGAVEKRAAGGLSTDKPGQGYGLGQKQVRGARAVHKSCLNAGGAGGKMRDQRQMRPEGRVQMQGRNGGGKGQQRVMPAKRVEGVLYVVGPKAGGYTPGGGLCQPGDATPVGRSRATGLQVEIGRRQRAEADARTGQILCQPRQTVARKVCQADGMTAQDRPLEAGTQRRGGECFQPVQFGPLPLVNMEIQREPAGCGKIERGGKAPGPAGMVQAPRAQRSANPPHISSDAGCRRGFCKGIDVRQAGQFQPDAVRPVLRQFRQNIPGTGGAVGSAPLPQSTCVRA